MAEVKVAENRRPDVELRLTWTEFEAVAASLAVAMPIEVVKWLRVHSPRTEIVTTSDYHTHTPFTTVTGFLEDQNDG